VEIGDGAWDPAAGRGGVTPVRSTDFTSPAAWMALDGSIRPEPKSSSRSLLPR
jgi:hypothetical protein